MRNRHTNLFAVIAALLLAAGLVISGPIRPAAALAEGVACSQYHMVQNGENLTRLARQFGVSVADLVRINQLADPNTIITGTPICVTWTEGTGQGAGNILPGTGGTATSFQITQVQTSTVTLAARNLPANQVFNLLASPVDPLQTAQGSWLAGFNSGPEGYFTATLSLPASLRTARQVGLLLQSNTPDSFVFACFNNQPSRNPKAIACGASASSLPNTGSAGATRVLTSTQVYTGSLPANLANLRLQNATTPLDTTNPQIYLLGNAGAYLPYPATGASLALARLPSGGLKAQSLSFRGPLLEVRQLDAAGNPGSTRGLVHVYFNLDAGTRSEADAGRLGIYQYDAGRQGWVPCAYPVREAAGGANPNGRLDCVATSLGIFALAAPAR